jgi:hypothetical protein
MNHDPDHFAVEVTFQRRGIGLDAHSIQRAKARRATRQRDP